MKLENLKDELISQQQELKKLCLETRSSLQNQIKQQGIFQNLVLDMKNSNENHQGAKKDHDFNYECKICNGKTFGYCPDTLRSHSVFSMCQKVEI